MSTRSNPAPEDTAALMMMAQTASYIPKEGLIPSFSLGLTDSSQEEALTQEGQGQPRAQKAKSSETSKLIEQLEELMEKIVNSGVKTTLDYAEGKNPLIEKQCAKEIFEKFEIPVKSKEMLAEMKEKCYVWATRVKTYGDGSTNEYDPIVTAMCLILNQQNIKRFQEEIYCLSPDIVNMAIGNHSDGEFLQPKSKKPFRVEDYPMFILFLDLKKLASHRYSIGICNFENEGICWGTPLKKKDHEIEPPYINISGQKISYDYAIYEEVDHFRVEFVSRILFHEMNQDRAKAIRGNEAVRLSKASSLLLSPYCQIDSYDIDSD
ncbi:hypothetical protein Ahy_B03g068871 [Arachis hypogaea]|uniref:Uncharacterized protein n=1 Tax=Arachis hypogaea TaxID=3818 RepID=A0A445AB48_ARAHY|nr:hypothetical protein Ahy_B03g068871 [Arachis hypogaea]